MGAVALLAALGTSSHSADWPQFRGPDGQGHSAEQGLPLAWSESENVAWKTPIEGLGWSSPVVRGRLIWLTTAIEQQGSLRRRLRRRPDGPVAARRRVISKSRSGSDQSQEQSRLTHASD